MRNREICPIHGADEMNRLVCLACEFDVEIAEFESRCLAHREMIGRCTLCLAEDHLPEPSMEILS